jgi:hypothetical protein
MLQDFHLKIVHHASSKHANVDVQSRNPMDRYKVDEDFGNEIQYLEGIPYNVSKSSFTKESETIINLFIVLTSEEDEHGDDKYRSGGEVIAFKVEVQPQVEIGQQ